MDDSTTSYLDLDTKTHRMKSSCHLRSMYYILIVVLISEVLFVKPRFFTQPSKFDEFQPQSQQLRRIDPIQSELDQNPSNTSTPLFYHISPGSTGSRTLYHASCSLGFPSVHHKSFCISSTRGIAGVKNEVVDGVKAHFEVLRLYEMAAGCLKIKNKINSSDADGAAVKMCNIPLGRWAANLQTQLTTVLRSGLVGLFDTPYPYLAPQMVDQSKLWRTNTIIGMTERDPVSWAKSRIKHGLLLCRDKYSFEELGSSEFDVLGCISRARQTITGTLHFWDVFQYRSHHAEVHPEFLRGMERQMDKHQWMYRQLAVYKPDFFGVNPSIDKRSERINEKDVAKDILHLLSTFRRHDQMPLKCRGRVHWEMTNDTFIEIYHLPKTCSPQKMGKEKQVQTVPLI